MHGYFGEALRVDVTTGTTEALPLPPAVLRDFVGGVGLATWLLLHETEGNYPALAPEAPLVIGFAPLIGTALNTSAKVAVVSKSPLTDRLNDAMLSSRFALAGKAAGVDAIVIRGACAEWSTLWIEPGHVHLEPAEHLRGLSAAETEARLHAERGADWAVAAIGEAGEHGVPFASLSHDGRHAGRGGTGAVLGAKRLKAVAVRGDRATAPADAPALDALRERLRRNSAGHGTEKYRTTGTLGNLLVFNRLGILPTRNFQRGADPAAEGLSAERLFVEKEVSRATCADCTIGCEKRVTAEDGKSVRLEYENVFALGSLLGVWDTAVVLEASRLCDHFGLDTITTGGTLAFAMECVERGLLDEPRLRFGDGDVLLEAIPKIAAREGYGALLALGSRELARRIGGGSEAFAVHVKGLELPGYHPAHLQSLGLGFAVGSRGADHNKSSAYDLDLSGQVDRFHLDPARIQQMIALEDQAALIDSLILCKFVRRALDDFYGDAGKMLAAITGEAYGPEQLHDSASKIHHLKKLFNQRQGWNAREDMLPERFFAKPSDDGGGNGAENRTAPTAPAPISRDDFMEAREMYYLGRGWDAAGRPPAGLAEAMHLR